jgi:hypothetical protein
LLLDPEDGSDSFFRDTQRYNPEDLLNPDFWLSLHKLRTEVDAVK